MASLGLLGAIAGGVGTLGSLYAAKNKQDDEDARLEKKMKLARDLQLQILSTKQQFAKTNPVYKNFMKTELGNIVANDEYGNSKTVYEATPEEVDNIKAKTESGNAYRMGMLGLLSAKQPGMEAKVGAETDLARARAAALTAGKAPKGNPVSAADFAAKKAALAKSMSAEAGVDLTAILPPEDLAKQQAILDDPATTEAQKKRAQSNLSAHSQAQGIYADAAKQLEASGYKPGAFRTTGLVAPSAGDDSESSAGEDPEFDFMSMVQDPNNPAG